MYLYQRLKRQHCNFTLTCKLMYVVTFLWLLYPAKFKSTDLPRPPYANKNLKDDLNFTLFSVCVRLEGEELVFYVERNLPIIKRPYKAFPICCLSFPVEDTCLINATDSFPGPVRKTKGGRLKKCACPSCDKSFTDNFHLREHIAIRHELRKDFVCENCGKAFGSKFVLKRHIGNTHPLLFKKLYAVPI